MQIEDTTLTDKTRLEFIELVGRIVQADGLPRNAGRLMGLLIFDGGQISFGDLASSLQISRGSVSSSSRLLEEFGLIRRTSKPGERQDYFELEDDPYVNLLDRAVVRARRAKEAIDKTTEQLEACEDRHARLVDFADFYRTLEQCVCRTRLEMKDSNS